MHREAYLKTVGLALLSLFLVISIISFPQQTFEASLRGLTIWWDVVFPALLPFFITAELLMGFGVVHFLGIMLEPFMRPLFRVPGVGGFVMSMGLASGYPMGAKLTVRLREQELITRVEGERLVAITSTSGPLFMIGAVAVGFFHDVHLGIIIALAHYISALCLGLLMRFHHHQAHLPSEKQHHGQPETEHQLIRAIKAMHQARMEHGKTFGTLMGEAVESSVKTLLMIGGFIIMFSVIINLLNLVQFSHLLSMLFSIVLVPLGVNIGLISSLIAGIFEITLGSQMASQSNPSIPLMHKVAIASSIIAWSGLSVHAQVASMIAKTDIRYTPFLMARAIHGVLAYMWTLILWHPVQQFVMNHDVSVIVQYVSHNSTQWTSYTFFLNALWIIFFFLCIICVMILVAKSKKAAYKLKKRLHKYKSHK